VIVGGRLQPYSPFVSADRDRSWDGAMAETYDRHLGPTVFHPFAVDLVRRAAGTAAHRVLEVAAGSGVVTRELVGALPDATLVATDLNPAMVRTGAERVPRAHWAVVDGQRLPFRDRGFDLLVCQFGIMFLPDKPAAFAQARRVLAPGGRLLFTTWDALHTHGFERAVTVGLRRAFPDDPPRFLEQIPHGYHDLAQVVADVRAGGFTAVCAETVTVTGHAASAAALAVGYCTGTPLRAGIVGRGDLASTTARVEEALTAQLGAGPIEAEMSAHVVEAVR
jgi:SAM-dependent methyltransferase